ncbi:MAG: phage tail protein, partial [Candidatus Gastranaerophilales bacterium]|nr:phage tail protein [Candidatus Gastranaerophilales bacterium]
ATMPLMTRKKTASSAPGSVPVGTVVAYVGSIAPSGWLLCNGAEISRSGPYANLFALIGVAYGTGNGTTTFNIPDLRGYFIRGLDSRANASAIDKYFTENASARPLGSPQADAVIEHIHKTIVTGQGGLTTASSGNDFTSDGPVNIPIDTGNPLDPTNTAIVISKTETRPKNIAMNYIIKY